MSDIDSLHRTRVDTSSDLRPGRLGADSVRRLLVHPETGSPPFPAVWLQQVIESINQAASPENRLARLLRAALQGVPAADRGAVYLTTSQDHTFVLGAVLPSAPSPPGTLVCARGGYVDAVAQVQCSALIDDLEAEGQQDSSPWAQGVPAARSALAVPFVLGGQTSGVLSLENGSATRAFGLDDLELARLLTCHTTMAVENARLAFADDVISSLAHQLSDPLTAVLGFSELAMARSDVPLDCRADLEAIARHAQRGGRIVHELLSFVRLRKSTKGAGRT